MDPVPQIRMHEGMLERGPGRQTELHSTGGYIQQYAAHERERGEVSNK